MPCCIITGHTLDINVKDNDGQTPFMVAVTLGQIDAVRLLHKHGKIGACCFFVCVWFPVNNFSHVSSME